jgi:TatD DNase family protein
MIDTHCHIDFKDFNRDREDVIVQAVEYGVERLINIGVDPPSSRRSFEMANTYDNIYCTVGIHPHDARLLNDEFLSEMEKMAENPKVVGIGEIGLDYYRDLSPRDIQRQAFETQLNLAEKLNLPVVIHIREAMGEAIEIVDKFVGRVKGVFHCFPGTMDQAQLLWSMGFYISVNGVITYKDSRMARVAREVDIETILIETDCPFLTPVPHRGKRNVPAYVKHVCAQLAQLQKMNFKDVEKLTTRNAEKLFRLVEIFG